MSKYNDSSSLLMPIASLTLIMLFVCRSPLAGGDLPLGYPHEVEGVVASDPSTRYVRAEGGGQEKVAISLAVSSNKVPRTLLPAYNSGVIIMECLSTRCSQIKAGEGHVFACRGIGRFLEPNVVECKHARKL